MTVSEASAVNGAAKPRTIDVPLEKLPPIDEHAIEVDAPAEVTWEALFPTLEHSFNSRPPSATPSGIGAGVTAAEGDLHHPGGMLPGFTVIRAIEPVMLALAGRHRYSQYAVVFRIDLLPGQRSQVRIETRAEFLGRTGRLYRAGVIGTRGHVIVVNRMLRAIKRRAEQQHERKLNRVRSGSIPDEMRSGHPARIIARDRGRRRAARVHRRSRRRRRQALRRRLLRPSRRGSSPASTSEGLFAVVRDGTSAGSSPTRASPGSSTPTPASATASRSRSRPRASRSRPRAGSGCATGPRSRKGSLLVVWKGAWTKPRRVEGTVRIKYGNCDSQDRLGRQAHEAGHPTLTRGRGLRHSAHGQRAAPLDPPRADRPTTRRPTLQHRLAAARGGRRDPRHAAPARAPAGPHQGPPRRSPRARDGRGLVPDAGDRDRRLRPRRARHLPRARPARCLSDRRPRRRSVPAARRTSAPGSPPSSG